MDVFCESCGRRPSLVDRAIQRGVALCPDCGAYLCPDCRHTLDRAATSSPTATPPTGRGRAGLGPYIALGVIAALALLATQLPALMGTPGSGGVLDAVQTPGSSAAIGAAPSFSPPVASRGPTTQPSSQPGPSSSQAAATNGAAEPAPGEPVIATWKGQYGETRVQIILPVRNTGSGWLQLPRSSSAYLITDSEGLEVARGVFTAALPESIGPGDTGYLVDTLSVAFANADEYRSAKTAVRAIPVSKPDVVLSVGEVELSKGSDGGLRATGTVHNGGAATARSVVAGVIAVGENGVAVGALLDLTDVGDLEPGMTVEFDTEYPGAPPITGGQPGEVLGFAYASS